MDTSELNLPDSRNAAQPLDVPKMFMTTVMYTFLLDWGSFFFPETICVEDAYFTTFGKQFHIFLDKI